MNPKPEDLHIEIIRNLMEQNMTEMENRWIERQALNAALLESGLTQDQNDHLMQKAISDPELRQQAREKYANMRNALLAEAVPAQIEALEEILPPSGEPN